MQTRCQNSGAEGGFTLVELMVAIGVLAVVGAVAMSFMGSQTFLFAKNTALNESHVAVRSELDRLTDELQQAEGPPGLIDTNGAAVATGPAAGLQFDRLVGYSYVLQYPGSPGLRANTQMLTVTRSVNALTAGAIPQPEEILLIGLPNSDILRAQIASVVPSAATIKSGVPVQDIKLNLTAQLGTAMDWRNPLGNPPQQKTVKVVRHEAFIVMPSGGRNELRFYRNFQPVPPQTLAGILNNPTQYVVITNDVSTAAAADPTLPPDAKPFSIDNTGGNRAVKANLGVQSQDYVNSMSGKEDNNFNTFVRIQTALPSRQR